MSPADNEHLVAPSQLCIGMHVHLDMPWTAHPFAFSSFKIKSLDQIAAIQELGIKSLRFSPAKSDSAPLPLPAEAPSEPAPATPAEPPPLTPAQQAKRERLQRLDAHRATVLGCEKELMSASRTIKQFTQNLFARPAEAREAAATLIDGIADSMLLDVEVAVHLMADKIGGEEVYLHALNVALLSMVLAKELKAPPAAIRLVGLGAMFHDVGKLELPDRVVRKTDGLTRPEVTLLQRHVPMGLDIGRKLGLPPEALLVLAQHHERMDGQGYPKGLQGPQISLLARVVALVNAYDNLCNPLPPAKGLTPHEALSVLYGQQRDRFDANAMATFVRCMGIYPPGTLVVLSNGTLGLVVAVNSSRPLKPTVRVFDPSVPKEMAIVVDLEAEPDVSVAKALRADQLPEAALDYLSPRRNTTYYFSTEGK